MTLPVSFGLALAGLLGAFGTSSASAAAPPVLDRGSTTVTSDVLPTAQINATGWVQDQAIVGDTVYAGGSFSSARPAGAAAGTSESTRNNLLAYSLSTGVLDSGFAPNVNGEVRVLALSPDKSRLYVGGKFTSVNGTSRLNIVAFDTATKQVDPSFKVSVGSIGGSDTVDGISATDSTVYLGGSFTSVNGVNRGRLAAVRASDGGLLSTWTPKTGDSRSVKTVLVAPGGNVLVGGSFATMGNLASGSSTVSAPGSASLSPSNASLQTWKINSVVKQYGSQGSVLSMTTDGTNVYGSGFWYGGTESNFEGTWSANPSDGSIRWLADCHGDTYDSTVLGGVVYATSHEHDCSNIGAFPEQVPTRTQWRTNAFTVEPQGDVQPNSLMPDKFKDFSNGNKAPALINWFPQFSNPKCATSDCGERLYANQPTISIESSGDYVTVAGQFPTVNGINQQGLVRFAKPSVAPKKDGPRLYNANGPAVRAVSGNVVRVTASPWDRDGRVLSSVQLWRTDKSSPVVSKTDAASPWWTTTLSYTDKSPNFGAKYYVKLTDADGNTYNSAQVGVSAGSGSLSDSSYSNQVVADGANSLWRFDDQANTAAPGGFAKVTDWAGDDDLILGTGGTLRSSGVGSDPGVTMDGTLNGTAATAGSTPAPQTYSAEAWFKTSSTTGGQIFGYGNSGITTTSGKITWNKSYLHDRQVVLSPSGQIVYFVKPGGTSRSIVSPKSYNDGKWHQVVATLSSGSGMVLYVDGAKVASWASITSAQSYGGFWRIGGDNISGVPGTSGSGALTGSIDDVSVYGKALSASQVSDHYTKATGAAPAKAPTAAFTTACTGLTCTFDASASQAASTASAADAGSTPSGSAESSGSAAAPARSAEPTTSAAAAGMTYAWSFGDGGKSTVKDAATIRHSYRKAARFDVGLTVTDRNRGASATAIQTIKAVGNAAPTASFTVKVKDKKISVDAGRSSDSDGKIVKYAWSFGDGGTSSKKKLSHSYRGKGIYLVRLTVTDDDGSKTSSTKTVRTGGSSLAYDTFGRSGGGWGKAGKGGTWKVSPASAFSLDGDDGEIKLAKPGSAAYASLSKVSSKKANVVAEVSPEKLGSAKGTIVGYSLRQRSTNAYRTKLVITEPGVMYLQATRLVGGKEKTIKTVKVKGTFTPGTTLRLRATVSSANKAKITMTVWKAGTSEPKAQLSTTDSTKAMRKNGTVGVLGYQPSDATAGAASFDLDNLLVTSS